MIIRFRFRGLSFLLPNPPPNWKISMKSFTTQLSLLEDASLSFRFFSSSSSPTPSFPSPKEYSFTVSYLINSCGLSPESALSASRKLQLVTPERPDSVLTLLRNYGITDTQLPKLIRVFPSLLLADPEKTLLPKLEFFHSKALTRADLGTMLSSCPMVLSRSLDYQIIPCYNFLKSILHLDKRVVLAFKRSPRIFLVDVNKCIVPKITALREIGVPQSSVVFLMTIYPNLVQLKHERFGEIVKEVMEMGFDPLKMAFIQAIQVFGGMTKSTREQKMEVYRRWGLSNDEIMLLFRTFPLCMTLSEKKITSIMDFLVNKMGWKVTAITRASRTLSYSLQKRIIPRCSVGKVLILNGLVKKDLGLLAFLRHNEKKFLDRFVIKYQNHIPQLLNLYKGKVSVLELGFASEELCGVKQS